MQSVIMAAVSMTLVLLSNIAAYKLGEANEELKQIRRETKVINEIDPMEPDAGGMIEAMLKLQKLRKEDKKR